MNKQETIKLIKYRIKTEFDKYKDKEHIDWTHIAASKIYASIFHKPSILRLGGDGNTHFVDEIWMEKSEPCDMVGLDGEEIRREQRVFEGTMDECNNFIKYERS